MPHRSRSFATVAAARVLVAGLLLTLAPVARADDDAPRFNPEFRYTDETDSCERCHVTPSEVDRRKPGRLERVKLTEFATWNQQDWHREAHLALASERGQLMGKVLNLQPTTDTRCLSCHSGHCAIDPKSRAAYPAQAVQLTAPTANIAQLGVSCEACHGPARDWQNAHFDDVEVRDSDGQRRDVPFWKLTAADKLLRGLLDVRQPVSRAEICLSCHIGDGRQGKLITHDMYAAGHPPLAGFEIETFDGAMPVHGFSLEKKPVESRPAWSYGAGDLYRTRSVLATSLVAAQFQVRLIRDLAGWAIERDDNSLPPPERAANMSSLVNVVTPSWPELAVFDCASCHHELRTTSWRQQRGYAGPPGRPALRAWPQAMYWVVGGEPSDLLPLAGAVGRRPFGDPRELHAAATEVLQRVLKTGERLETTTIDAPAARNYLLRICQAGLKQLPEYDDARQLAWSLGAIVDDWLAAVPDGLSAAQRQAITAVRQEWNETLSLTVASRAANRTPLESTQHALRRAFDYDPQAFQAQLRRVSEILAERAAP